jgi:hypothetical protein
MDETIRLWDVASAKPLHTFVGHSGWIMSIAVSPDGRTLVSGSADSTMLLWPLDRFVKGKPVQAPRLSEKELQARLAKLPDARTEALWSQLAEPDARRAYRAMWGLVRAHKESLVIVRKWIGPICEAPIATWIADLGHDDFSRREKASLKLEQMGRLARPALQVALRGKLDLEARRRIERVLALTEIGLDAGCDEGLRLLRSVEVLEHVGNAEAQALLAQIAKSSVLPDASDHARAALERLSNRR